MQKENHPEDYLLTVPEMIFCAPPWRVRPVDSQKFDMIDLTTWNLTIPVGTPSKVIDTPRLVGGYSDRYFRSGNTLFFCSPVTGSTTTNSEFPRSELRETFNDGRLRNWTYPQADNALKATLAINQMPSSGRVVIGQIHIYQGKGPLLKVEYLYDAGKKKGDVVAKYRQKPGSDDTAIIIAKDIAGSLIT